MTTRFFDFRRYAFKGKTLDLPIIKKKNENPISSSQFITTEPISNFSKNTNYNSSFHHIEEVNSPSSKNLDLSRTKSTNQLFERDQNVTDNFNISNESQKKIYKNKKNNEKSYEEFRSVLFSSTPTKQNSDEDIIHIKNNITKKSEFTEDKLSDNSKKQTFNEIKNYSPVIIRKRLKRYLQSETDEKSNDNLLFENSLPIKKPCKEQIEISDDKINSDDETTFRDLQECLEVSEVMKETIISSLGGQNLSNRKIISDSFQSGRFNAHQSYNLPEDLKSNFLCITTRLKEYQKCGIHWLITLHNSHRNGILADEMGLGKTAQTCVFLNYLYVSGKVSSPTIIASPASLLDNWVNEIKLWAPYLRGHIIKYQGKQSERRELILDFIHQNYSEKRYFILVTSINTLASNWDLQYLKQIKPLAYLVIDEAHSLKNEKSQAYRKLNKVFFSDRRLLLTGSPIQNKTIELKNLLLFVMPHVFNANSLDAALNYYEKQLLRESDLQSENNLSSNEETKQFPIDNEEKKCLLDDVTNYLHKKRKVISSPDVQCLQKILGPFILRRLKSEVLCDLPAKKSIVLRCEIEGQQATLYLNEINRKTSRLISSLKKLTSLIDSTNSNSKQLTDQIECNKLNSEKPQNVQEFNFDNCVSMESDKERTEIDSTTDSQTSVQSNKQFVNSIISRLRRICNHPLLMQGYYNDEQMKEIIDHYHRKVEGFMGNTRKKVETEIRKWSDFEIHQGIQILIQSNDKHLERFLLPKETLLESAKIRNMLEIVKDLHTRGEKVLIFSHFTSYLNIVEECLINFLPNIQFCRLDGATNVSERQNLVDNFNNLPEISIFLLSTKAGGQGLNLSSARNVILMDQDWNPQNDRQAEDRVHRLGQTKEVIVYRLCCRATIEETILECCQKKLDLDEAFGGDSELLQVAILQESIYNSDNLKSIKA